MITIPSYPMTKQEMKAMPRHPKHPKFIWIKDHNTLANLLGGKRTNQSVIEEMQSLAKIGLNFVMDYWTNGGIFYIRNGIVSRLPHHNKGHHVLRGRHISYVSVYKISRHYGGPEEGGWWYDWNTHVRSYPRRVRACRVERIKALLVNQYQQPRFPRSSVVGGADVEVFTEQYPGQNQSKHTPHYE